MYRARSFRLALVIALAASLVGCQRKAPGPAECLELAYRTYGVRTAAELRIPGMKARVDELTQECLLTPYDRELVECTLQGGPPRSCLRAFKLRRTDLTTTPAQPRPATRTGRDPRR